MNTQEIRRTLEIFKSENELIEIRGIKKYGSQTSVPSGYFKDIDKILQAIKAYEDDYNLYFIMNTINPDCYSRIQHDKMIVGAPNTKANDVLARDWLLIDLDPKRTPDISSTDEEKAHARVIGNQIKNYLRDIGFPYPVVCDSGNGYHLLYKIAIDNTKKKFDKNTQPEQYTAEEKRISENNDLIENFLKALDYKFTDDEVDVDTKVYDACRITKLYGTIARKGANTPERPHRQSKIIQIPSEIKEVPKVLLKKVADTLPTKEKPTYSNNYTPSAFGLSDFIQKHNIKISRDYVTLGGIHRYILEECPFDSSHKAPDSMLIEMPTGEIGFFCFHNSCSNYHWREFRQLYEPNAYESRYEQKLYKPIYNRDRPEFKVQEVTEEKGEKWLKLSNVKMFELNENDFIPTGFTEFDKKALGLQRGQISILSALRGGGKTTWLNQLSLNSCERGYNVACWSGELSNGETKQWLYLQAAGRQYTRRKGTTEYYYTPEHVNKKIDTWIDKHYTLYSEAYGNDFRQIFNDVEVRINEEKLDLVILDNLMTLDFDSISGDLNEKQKKVIQDLAIMARKYNIHIVIVAHPNKTAGLLRINHISGTGNIANLAQNVFILHRVKMDEERYNKDFEIDADTFWGAGSFNRYKEFSNIVEIAKLRSKGSLMGTIMGFFFEKESGRFLNEQYENINYGWQELKENIIDLTIQPNTAFDEEIKPVVKTDNSNLFDDSECPF